MQVPEAMRPLLRVWSHRNYACFMGGMSPALITLWMQRIGMLWLAWELTRSNTWVGIIVALDYLPMLLLAPFVGAFTDRANPVQVQKWAQWLNLALSAVMAGLTFAGLMNIWLLAFLSLVLGCLHPFNAISRHAIVPNTVPKEEIPTALATDSALYNAARFIGPALAGVLIEFVGVGYAIAANSVGCAFYLLGLYAMRLDFPDRKGHGHAGMLKDIAEGLAYVRGHAGIGPLFLLMTIGAIWIRPLQDLLPGFADQVFQAGPSGLGILTAAMGVGATIAAAFVAMYARTTGLVLFVMLAFLANILATWAFVATSFLWIAVLFAALWGGTLTMMSTGTQALVQSAVDNSIRARVMSLYTMIYRGAPFLGAIVIGWAADRIGLQLAFAIAALLCVLPWLNAIRKRTVMTIALEGRGNDLDERLMAKSKALAGLAHEQLVDLRLCAKPIAGKVASGTRSAWEKTRNLKIGDKLQALRQRKD
jgi:MFS family permease